jgi:taurine dioxygenase
VATTLDLEPLTSSIGAAVHGLDPRAVDATTAPLVRTALAEHGVLVFRAPGMTVDEQVEFASRFGAPIGHPVRAHLGGEAEDPVALVENHGEKPSQDDQHFHTDYSFHTHVPELAILRPEILPSRGGDTIWSSASAAFRLLSDRFVEFLRGLAGVHDAGARFWFEVDRTLGSEAAAELRKAFPPQEHPIVGRHPLTGTPLLFVNPGYTVGVTELNATEGRATLGALFDIVNDSSLHFRHRWHADDVVMWDELTTVHRAPSDFFPEHRRLTRVAVGRTAPEPLAA